jgi:hypothetical protein
MFLVIKHQIALYKFLINLTQEYLSIHKMNKKRLFDYLKNQDKKVLINLLEKCYDCMKTQQILEVFYYLEKKLLTNPEKLEGKSLLQEVQKFRAESQQGVYYAPFNINSKNYMEVPEETQMWFEKLGDLLKDSTLLSNQGDYKHAVECFSILYTLMDDPYLTEKIIFGDEVGMWMLGIKEEPCIKAYLTSAAAIYKPEEFVKIALLLIEYDRGSSFMYKVYEKAQHVANKAQKLWLEKEVARLGIKPASDNK